MRDQLLKDAISTSFRKAYTTGFNQYVSFTAQIAAGPFPLTQGKLELFVASISNKVSFTTIKVYLSGIQFYSSMYGFSEKISRMKRLSYVLRGTRRSRVVYTNHREPIRFRHLSFLYNFFSLNFNRFDKRMLRAATCVAFFGLFRSAEYTSPSSTFWDPRVNLGIQDVQFAKKAGLNIRIKSSKTDPFKEGCTVELTRLSSKFCPVRLLTKYLEMRGFEEGPLFIYSDNSFLTRNRLSSILSHCFPNECLNTHSFRIGGASSAAKLGIPSLLIKKLGRWKSDTFMRYIRYEEVDTKRAQQMMGESMK